MINLWNFFRFKPKPMLITTEQLSQVCLSLKPVRAALLTNLINESCLKYGIKTKGVLHELLSNIIQESGEFSAKEENMNYRKETLMKVWPSRFPTLESTNGYAKSPMALANKVYGGRMGNTLPNDGWNFRGGGFIGLTGREVYTKYASYAEFQTVEEAAEAVRTEDRFAMDSAFWFVCVLKDLEDEAEREEFIGIVKSINGGLIGLKDRQFYYERCKKFIV